MGVFPGRRGCLPSSPAPYETPPPMMFRSTSRDDPRKLILFVTLETSTRTRNRCFEHPGEYKAMLGCRNLLAGRRPKRYVTGKAKEERAEGRLKPATILRRGVLDELPNSGYKYRNFAPDFADGCSWHQKQVLSVLQCKAWAQAFFGWAQGFQGRYVTKRANTKIRNAGRQERAGGPSKFLHPGVAEAPTVTRRTVVAGKGHPVVRGWERIWRRGTSGVGREERE